MRTLDAIVLAGGIPAPEEPLYPFTQGQPKTLLPLAGKPMVQWVLEALSAADSIRHIVVVGIEAAAPIASSKIIAHVPDQGSLFRNGAAGIAALRRLPSPAAQIALCSGDIPLITAEMVTWAIAACPDPEVDLYHFDVPRDVMEARFPGSRRTYVHFADGDLAGGDFHIVAPTIVDRHGQLWEDLISNRKHALKQALRLGPQFFIKLALRRLRVEELERKAARSFGLRVRVLRAPYPELGMDVDKPVQLELCRRELEARAS